MFIVIEGLDGAGTTTQAKRLVDRVAEAGGTPHFTCEPTEGPIGVMIRKMLALEVTARDGEPINRESLALLFAADRMDHVASEIDPALERGEMVVSDRYYHSSLAYQGDVDDSDHFDFAWVWTLNCRATRPDLTFFLKADVDTCIARLTDRGDARDIYETRAKLERLAARYEQVVDKLAKVGHPIVTLDASDSIEWIGDQIWDYCMDLRA